MKAAMNPSESNVQDSIMTKSKGRKPSASLDSGHWEQRLLKKKRQAKITVHRLVKKTNALANALSSIKNTLICSICLQLFSIPHTLVECGHSYCWHCLVSWLRKSDQDKKECPTCRSSITQKPIYQMLLNDQVQVLIDALELESVKKEAEEDWVVFKSQESTCWEGLMVTKIVKDVEDGIDRCGSCGWEVVDGICANCNRGFGVSREAFLEDNDCSEAELIDEDDEDDEDYRDPNEASESGTGDDESVEYGYLDRNI